MQYLKKSQFLLAFILLLYSTVASAALINQTIVKAQSIGLHKDPKWRALIHYHQNEFNITDTNFLLASSKASPLTEMVETIQYYFQNSQRALCKYPARIYFLNTRLSFIKDFDIKHAFSHCKKLSTFLNFVPFHKVKLNFASEVLSSASSMMGHIFISAEGVNVKNNNVAHSVSFFTEISTFNPIALIYDGTISGMPGFFMVRPYKVDKRQYVENEQRNLWSYELNISEFDRKLMQLHIWELQDINFKYTFQSYNCATLTMHLLALSTPEVLDEIKLFVSPVDVVKASKKKGLVISEGVFLAEEWEISMLEEQLSNDTHEHVVASIFYRKPFNLETDKQTKYLLKRYIELVASRQSKLEFPALDVLELNKLSQQFHQDGFNYTLDLSHYKNPIYQPQDSQVRFSFSELNQEHLIGLSFLPASHDLYSDNRQLLGESELKIGDISLQLNTSNGNIDLDRLTLYGVKSYIPSTKLVPQTSGEFFLGYKRKYLFANKNKGVGEISGLYGKTYAVHKDVNVFVLAGSGISTDGKNLYSHLEAKTGGTMYLISNTKATYELSYRQGNLFYQNQLLSHKLSLSWFAAQNSSLTLTHNFEKSKSRDASLTTLSYQYNF